MPTVFMKPLRFAILMLLAVACSLPAQEKLSRDMKFVDALNKEKLFDYCLFFLKFNLNSDAKETERYRIALADTYIKMGKMPEANAIISKIPRNSPYYYTSKFVLGKAALERGKFNDGIKLLLVYINHFKTNPPKDKQGNEEFRAAVSFLSWAYKQTNQAEKSEETLKLLTEDPREATLFGLNTKLDVAENLYKEEKLSGKKNKKWRQIAEKAIPQYEELRWAGVDAITLLSLVGAGRAYYLLGDYKNALDQLSRMPEFFDIFDKEFKKTGQGGQSPGAQVRYWLGKVFMAMAEKDKNKQEQIKYYIKALKKFLYVLKKYDNSQNAPEAYSNLVICQKELQERGKTVQLPADLKKPETTAEATIVSGDAEKYFKEKKYSKAIPILLNSVNQNRTADGVQDALYKLIFSYVSTNQTLEALALGEYFTRAFPKAEMAPIALLQAGQVLWNNKKIDDATFAYEIYLNNTPAHQYGADIAMKVAKHYYDTAAAIAKNANKLKGEAKKKKVAEAVKAFKKSIPSYDRIIKNYGNRKDRVESAFYLKALSYASANEYVKAAETYLKFCDTSKDKAKLANAKLSAADNYFQGGQFSEDEAQQIRDEAYTTGDLKLRKTKLKKAETLEKDAEKYYKSAVSNLKELINNWLAEGGRLGVPNTKKLTKAVQSANILLAYAYGAAGDKKSSINTFKNFITKYPESPKVPACMSRMGVLYYELDNYTASAKVLEALAKKFPNTKEAKNAYYNLGRNMYEIGNYAKAFEVFNKMFNQKIEVSVQNLRWMASNLSTCGKEHPKEGAILALTSARVLLQKIKTADKDMAPWVGVKNASRLKADKKEKTRTLKVIEQKILYDAGVAARYAEDPTTSIAYLDKLLEDQKTPYLYKALFARADSYIKVKDYDKARKDLSNIAMTAMTAKKDSLVTEAKCKIGQTYIAQKSYKKAFASYNLIAKSLNTAGIKGQQYPPNLTEKQIVELKEERKKEMKWIGEAVYQGAFCAAKLGKDKDAKKLKTLYKKHFPDGPYISEINNLPEAENK